MDVTFNIMGHIVVKDMGNAFDVQPPRGNIRCNEQLELGFPESLHDRFPLRLGQIPVQLVRLIAMGQQRLVQRGGSALRPAEDDREEGIMLFDHCT